MYALCFALQSTMFSVNHDAHFLLLPSNFLKLQQLRNVQEELQAAKVEKENLMEEYSLAKKEHEEKEGNFLTVQEGLTQDISALKEAISQAEKTIESLQSSMSTTSMSLEESKDQVLSVCGERDALQKQLEVVSAEMMGDSKAAIATLQVRVCVR